MIIATAIGKLLEGKTADVIDEGTPKFGRTIYFHYGDQKELLQWTKARGNQGKYPLIWYVLNDYTREGEWYLVDAKVVIMQHTKGDPLNTWRQSNSYVGIINPVNKVFEQAMINKHVIIIPDSQRLNGYGYKDEPNFGNTDNSDLQMPSSDEHISQDIVDARVIRFDLRIKAECIIN